MANLTYARGDFALLSLPQGGLLAIAGETYNRGERTEVATQEVIEYVVDHDTWVERAPMPEARFRMDAAMVDGVAYVFGGHSICSADDCPETDTSQAFFHINVPDVFLVTQDESEAQEAADEVGGVLCMLLLCDALLKH